MLFFPYALALFVGTYACKILISTTIQTLLSTKICIDLTCTCISIAETEKSLSELHEWFDLPLLDSHCVCVSMKNLLFKQMLISHMHSNKRVIMRIPHHEQRAEVDQKV